MHTAVVSASRNAALVLDRAGLTGLVDVLVDGLVAEERQLSGKPDPASFFEAAHRAGCSPRRCVVVEDSTAGVLAGAPARSDSCWGWTGPGARTAPCWRRALTSWLPTLRPLGCRVTVDERLAGLLVGQRPD